MLYQKIYFSPFTIRRNVLVLIHLKSRHFSPYMLTLPLVEWRGLTVADVALNQTKIISDLENNWNDVA